MAADSTNATPLLSVGAVVRLTGLSEHVLRAWERRYSAVVPIRTPGGTRRYRDSDVQRLRLLRDTVANGSRISDVAKLDDDALKRLCQLPEPETAKVAEVNGLAEVLQALTDFDLDRAKQIVAHQLSALGPAVFTRDFVAPLMQRIGDEWARDALCIGSEHLGSTLIRGALESALRAGSSADDAPTVLFATPTDERHEIGLLMAATIAQSAGARPLYLGPDLPLEEIVTAADRAGVQAVALSFVTLSEASAAALVRDLRARLAPNVDLWVGGAGATAGATGVAHLGSLDELEKRVAALRAHQSRKAG